MTSVPPKTCNINNTFHISNDHTISPRSDSISLNLFKPHIIVQFVQFCPTKVVQYLRLFSLNLCQTYFAVLHKTENSAQIAEFGRNEFSIPVETLRQTEVFCTQDIILYCVQSLLLLLKRKNVQYVTRAGNFRMDNL